MGEPMAKAFLFHRFKWWFIFAKATIKKLRRKFPVGVFCYHYKNNSTRTIALSTVPMTEQTIPAVAAPLGGNPAIRVAFFD